MSHIFELWRPSTVANQLPKGMTFRLWRDSHDFSDRLHAKFQAVGTREQKIQQLTELLTGTKARRLREATKKDNPEHWKELVDQLLRLKAGVEE